MKKRYMILFIMTAFVLCSCGSDISESQDVAVEEKLVGLVGVADVPRDDVALSTENKEVVYQGKAFEKSLFATGANRLYVTGSYENGDYFIGTMQTQGSVFEEISIEMEAGMRAFNMTVDRLGRCHILWMSVEKVKVGEEYFESITGEKSVITIVNTTGDIEQEIDVSDVFSSGYNRPYNFIVDEEGQYYFESGAELITISEDGTLGGVIACDGIIQGIGLGKSSNVYVTYRLENGEVWLGNIEGEDTCKSLVCMAEADAIYQGIFAGTDCEIILLNKSNGIYSYAEHELEIRLSASELPVSGEKIGGYGMLMDGRVCVMSQSDEGTTYYYIVP